MVDQLKGTGGGIRSDIVSDVRDRSITPDDRKLIGPRPSISNTPAPTPNAIRTHSPYRDRQLCDQPSPWGEPRARYRTTHRRIPDHWSPTHYLAYSFIGALVPGLLLDNLPQEYFLLLFAVAIGLNYSLLLPIVHRIKQ